MGIYKKRGAFSLQMNKQLRSNELFEYAKSHAKEEGLDIHLRGNCIHIYYQGGKILEIKPSSKYFDKKYFNEKSTQFSKSELEEKVSELLDLKKHSPKDYFRNAKNVMDKWFVLNQKEERRIQQLLSMNNKTTDNLRLAVIDIEFAVSALADYYNRSYYKKTVGLKIDEEPKQYPNPRYDIIAVDKNGQLYVLELKVGTSSCKNMQKHRDDFDNHIGSEEIDERNNDGKSRWQVFVKEIQGLLETKQDHNLLDRSINIRMNKPIFLFAYKDSKKISQINDFKNLISKIKTSTDFLYIKDDNILTLNK